MATSDNITLLSKVVSFVTRPVLGRSAAFEAAQAAPEQSAAALRFATARVG